MTTDLVIILIGACLLSFCLGAAANDFWRWSKEDERQ